MNSSFTLSSIGKGIVTLVLLAFLGFQANAQTATINNNGNCAVDVYLAGVSSTCTICPDVGSPHSVAGNTTGVVVNLVGNGTCPIVDAFKAVVENSAGNTALVRTGACISGCGGTDIPIATLDYPAFPATCYMSNTTLTVEISCSGTDITIDIY